MTFRTESDSMGPVQVPADAYYGAQTQRAIENFPISGRRFTRFFIEAIGRIKRACVEVNLDLKRIDEKVARAIADGAQEVADGKRDGDFVLDVYQTGSGTSTNMNANEVIANVANVRLGGKLGDKKPVHANDHVNMGQSSNDVIPTATHVSALLALKRQLVPALEKLHASLDRKAKEFDAIVKIGRTHLMDAVPVRLGQEFSGYAMQVRKGVEAIARASEGLHELALGGSAVGTGLTAHPEFGRRVAEKLAQATGLPLREARNHFEAQAGRDDLIAAHGALNALACSLTKIANDIRWMGSGPACGLGEIQIPDLQPGSSIMPGKVNPVMSEVMTQVAARVMGNNVTITLGAQGGAFELNVMIPVMIDAFLESASLLANACTAFAEKCVDGIKANAERCEELAQMSSALVTALNRAIGYDKAAQIAKEAQKKKVSVRKLVLEQKLITEEEAAKIFDLRRMTEPG